jgi:hypothetical protein
MPVNETIELEGRLQSELAMGIDQVVVNAVLPERFNAEEAERIEAANGSHPVPGVRAALRAAESEHGRARTQRWRQREHRCVRPGLRGGYLRLSENSDHRDNRRDPFHERLEWQVLLMVPTRSLVGCRWSAWNRTGC